MSNQTPGHNSTDVMGRTSAGWMRTLSYLASQKDMFPCLWHRPICSRHYQDTAVHLQHECSTSRSSNCEDQNLC